jgi:phosphoglycolate phosphatase-like HAD superfamily hydrolase
MNPSSRPHVVWDWNGTLLADQQLVVDALNHVLDHHRIERMDIDSYRRLYTRPLQLFYERVFGRPIDPDEWVELDELYHQGYRDALATVELAVDAHIALDTVEAAGATQSLLSMYPHQHLVPLVDRFGLTERFAMVDGLRGDGGGQKAPELVAHLEQLLDLTGGPIDQVIVVGDALDDAAAAEHVGARCVLYDGGSHPRAELEATGLPVASTLTEALQQAGLR